ncbi:hypothetical protein [Nonomuraea candida]|uniref:hypothetical protein n=1 Tax=Nonomuraea candida TaxID=359159 RepID=UPI0005B8158D|nr:hypothetical protein [Nonomuraea candida]
MREPQPTPADQWSVWETEPQIPSYWPGLGLEREDGFEIHRGSVRGVAGRLVGMAVSAGDFDSSHATTYGLSGLHWNLPRELHAILTVADRAVTDFWGDVYAETGMAGLLIERAAGNYQLVDQAVLGDLPLDRLEERIQELAPGGRLRGASEMYPNGGVSLELPRAVDHGIGDMTAELARRDIEALAMYGVYRDPHSYRQMADALVELANTLQLRAQDLRDSPWYGDAADNAQEALRQIYGNVTALAASAGALSSAAGRFAEIIEWCRANFETMVDPDRSGWDEFWDLGGTANSRARGFLAQANDEFLNVYDMLPKRIQENLPGLLVTDESLARLKGRVQESQESILDNPGRGDMNQPWLRQMEHILTGYERAEENYG